MPSIDDTTPASLADALERAGRGDRAAFAEVYRRTSAKLFSVCLRICPRREEAEEVLQDVYLSVWRRAASFDPRRGGAMTWLITLARNRAIDRLRATRADGAPAILFTEPTIEPTAADAFDEDRLNLLRCLETLGAEDAAFLRAAFFEGSTYAELAARAALPLGTLKSRIRRALLKLRDCLR